MIFLRGQTIKLALITELTQNIFPVAPIRFHLNPKIQINLVTQEVFDILTRLSANKFEKTAFCADNYTLLRFTFYINNCSYV